MQQSQGAVALPSLHLFYRPLCRERGIEPHTPSNLLFYEEERQSEANSWSSKSSHGCRGRIGPQDYHRARRNAKALDKNRADPSCTTITFLKIKFRHLIDRIIDRSCSCRMSRPRCPSSVLIVGLRLQQELGWVQSGEISANIDSKSS